MSHPHILLGSGGHSKVLLNILFLQSHKILGYTDIVTKDPHFYGLTYLGTDDRVFSYDPGKVALVNGIGQVPYSARRIDLYEHFSIRGYRFANVIHPSSIIGMDVKIGDGVQIMAGAIIQPATTIGNNTIINTKASVDHDCRIGNHVHLAPGSTISGNVVIEDNVFIGAGATVIQGIHIGQNSVVGAGSLVVKDVPPNATVFGVPAEKKRS